MRIEACAAGVDPVKFLDLTPYETAIAIRGFGRRLKYLQLVMSQLTGQLVNAWAKGNLGREMTEAILRSLEDG